MSTTNCGIKKKKKKKRTAVKERESAPTRHGLI